MEAATRRRKHWGWGYEDQQPDRAALEATAKAIHERLGFEVDEIEEPVPFDEVELAEPRLKPPRARGDVLGRAATTASRTRSARPIATWSADSAGEFQNPPDLVAYPESAEDVDVAAHFCGRRGRGGDPLRRRHQRGRRRRAAGRRRLRGRGQHRPAAAWTGCSRSTRSRALRASRPAPRAGARGAAARARPDVAPLPQSFEYSTLGGWIATRAGGHFATSTRTSTTWSSRCGR